MFLLHGKVPPIFFSEFYNIFSLRYFSIKKKYIGPQVESRHSLMAVERFTARPGQQQDVGNAQSGLVINAAGAYM